MNNTRKITLAGLFLALAMVFQCLVQRSPFWSHPFDYDAGDGTYPGTTQSGDGTVYSFYCFG